MEVTERKRRGPQENVRKIGSTNYGLTCVFRRGLRHKNRRNPFVEKLF